MKVMSIFWNKISFGRGILCNEVTKDFNLKIYSTY